MYLDEKRQAVARTHDADSLMARRLEQDPARALAEIGPSLVARLDLLIALLDQPDRCRERIVDENGAEMRCLNPKGHLGAHLAYGNRIWGP